VRSGYVAANSMAIGPPSPCPNITTRPQPTASITVVTSSIHCSTVGSAPSGTGSEMPVPRLSKQMTRPVVARRSRNREIAGSSHMISMLFG
jgi:hypothetical protein